LGLILRHFLPAFLAHYPRTAPGVVRVLNALAACRTPALGGHVAACTQCGHTEYHYHSCGDRHCPSCGGSKRAAWLERQQRDLLPVPYFHLVFTLPHELSALILGNRKIMYDGLFTSSSQTLQTLGADPKRLGARLGALMVLHTWGQQLQHHPHIHAVVPGGGLSLDGTKWVASRGTYLLPVPVLGSLFRGKYLAGLRSAYDAGQLQFGGSTASLAEPVAFQRWLSGLYAMNWVVYAKKPFAGPEVLLRYLTRYTHRVALSNGRLVHLQGDRVTLSYKDYADGCQRKEMTLEAVELVRRFALHILPKGYVRVRQVGLLAHRDRTARLQQCRQLLGALPTSVVAVSSAEAAAASSEPSVPCAAAAAETSITMIPSPTALPTAKEMTAEASRNQAGVEDIPDHVSAARMLMLILAATGTLAWLLAVLLADDQRARKRCTQCGHGWMATIWERARPRGRRPKAAPPMDTS
jgi:Putative transposase/Transposase zinc-binding domain